MLHESVKIKKIVMYMGSQKFMNGYLGIHTDELNLPMLLFMLIRLKFGPMRVIIVGL